MTNVGGGGAGVGIVVSCGCGRRFETPVENAGRRTHCPSCARSLVIPRPTLEARFRAAQDGEEDPAVELATDRNSQNRPWVVSRLAIGSFVLGLSSFLFIVITGVPAIITGVMAYREIGRSRGLARGRLLAILGIVSGVFGSSAMAFHWLTPGFQWVRSYQQRGDCSNHLRKIGRAFDDFNSHFGHYPPGAIFGRDGQPILSWRVSLLQFLGPEERALFAKFHLDEPWDSPHNLSLLREMPEVYGCPSMPSGPIGSTVYQVLIGPRTMFTGKRRGVRLNEVVDGPFSTILVLEGAKPVPWTAPQELTFTPGSTTNLLSGAGASHSGGFNVLMADGAIRFFPDWISTITFDALATRDGGEYVNPP